MRSRKRGVVISNCQSQSLKHTLSLMCRDVIFEGLGVHVIPPDAREEAIAKFVAEATQEYEIVLSIPLSDEFGPLATSNIRTTFADKTVATITNFYFSGLHPDLTYVGGLARRMPGPLEDYHSKVALIGYLTRLSPSATVDMYRDSMYSDLKFYDEYEKSLAELSQRDAEVDIPFTAELATLLPKALCFFSTNHPSAFLLSRYCRKISQWLNELGLSEQTGFSDDPACVMNHLASSAIFPIYPEIAGRFGLEFSGNYEFKPLTVGDRTVATLTLEEFVEEEYKAFDGFSREELLNSPQVRLLL